MLLCMKCTDLQNDALPEYLSILAKRSSIRDSLLFKCKRIDYGLDCIWLTKVYVGVDDGRK